VFILIWVVILTLDQSTTICSCGLSTILNQISFSISVRNGINFKNSLTPTSSQYVRPMGSIHNIGVIILTWPTINLIFSAALFKIF